MPYSPERRPPHEHPELRALLSRLARLPLSRNPQPLARRITLDLHLHEPREDLRLLHAHLTPSDASNTTRDVVHEHNLVFLHQAVEHTNANVLLLTSFEALPNQQNRFLGLQRARVLYYQQHVLPAIPERAHAA